MGFLDAVKQRIRAVASEEITAAPAGAGPEPAPGSQLRGASGQPIWMR